MVAGVIHGGISHIAGGEDVSDALHPKFRVHVQSTQSIPLVRRSRP
jgi:hypothetical protein